MARRKADQVVEGTQQPEPEQVEATNEQPEPEPTTYTVRVRDDCNLDIVQSAGLIFSREPVSVPADAPYLEELRNNPLLEVQP